MLYSQVKLTQLPFCKTYGCKQVGKQAADDPVQPYVIITYHLTKADAWAEADHFPDGALMGVTLVFRRQPLTEPDKAVALALIKALTGGVYSKQVLEKCFTISEKNAVQDDYFSSETGLASGQVSGNLNWVGKCYMPIEGFKRRSLVTVYGTFH
ncbi:hypothetical protein DEIPH_ctg060orf0006 [Deinococcus phoenicis]|uniref:Uncharacterized protein n=1 Tax=Deinococcus phoenicis TaxID=1476583 RepID=A0A016QM20_9DEIO|nr:hypothetical protein DEIPH_ctg060orf0006 [Deinococcus phoenicis]